MCGICGYAGLVRDEPLLRRMTETLTHRGPDDDGFFLDGRIGLGMRRLSIIDVAGGKQPIVNEDSTLAIVFNGEIYNYRALVDDLLRRGHRFRTHSDTETILHLYEEYGAECVKHLRGMFAFAIQNTHEQTLFIARDRLGIKPLYYWESGGKFVFASEIKALLECDAISREPYLPAIDAYLSLRYVPGPETLLAGVRKFPAGHWLLYRAGQTQWGQYWAPRLEDGPYQLDVYYRERFAELFTETVRLHLESDVPLGAYLSGGIDSTAIVAAMSGLVSQPVKTFSVGFDWAGDELPAARETARRLGCDHHEVICRAEDIALLPKIVWHLDEPIGDAIVLPMYLLSQLAQRHVKVILTGEGGDETLAGYFFHKAMFWAGQYARWTPPLIQKRLVRPLINRIPTALLNRVWSYPAELGERGRRKVLDYLDVVAQRQPEREYRFLISLLDPRDKARLYADEIQARLGNRALGSDARTPRKGMAYLNALLELSYRDWLPDDILMKADKTNMANSVEGRVPFMDHQLVEFLAQVPPHLKLRGWTDKVLLRNYVARVMPGQTARRPKVAFYIPLEKYFATPAFETLLETCLSETNVRRRGYFAWSAVKQLRAAVRGGDFLYGKQVMALVMLELWHRIFIDRETGWV